MLLEVFFFVMDFLVSYIFSASLRMILLMCQYSTSQVTIALFSASLIFASLLKKKPPEEKRRGKVQTI